MMGGRTSYLQMNRAATFERNTEVAAVRDVVRSPGQPLDSGTREFMESRFGHDFSRVRVHTDTRAAESARSIGARAYAVGSDIAFGENEFAPATYRGRELLAHELTHTIQQRSVNGIPPSSDPSATVETSAREAGRAIADGATYSRSIPASGIGLSRTTAEDARWKNDVKAARYRGRLMANRIRTHGKLSKEARAKINQELAYFEDDAKEAYLQAVRPILKATVPLEMPEAHIRRRVPPVPPVTWSLLKEDPRQITDEQIYAPLIEAELEDAKGHEAMRQSKMEKLRQRTKGWGSDQEFALVLLERTLKASLNPDPRGVAASIGKDVLARYEAWLRKEDLRRASLCENMPGGVWGFLLKQQAGWNPSLNPCRRWFKDEHSRGPQELHHLARLLGIRGIGHDAVDTVYWSVREYRLLTDPVMLEQQAMASEMAMGIAGVGRVPGGPLAGKSGTSASASPRAAAGAEVAETAPNVIVPSRPVAGFARPLEPRPAPITLPPGGAVSTQMPPARMVQGNRPTYGVVAPAVETSADVSATRPSRPVGGFRPPPKDVAEKPGLIEVETGPREYIKKEYHGDVNPLGQQQSRYHVNIKLDEKGMMDADFVLRGSGKRSGSLSGKNEFLEAKQHFEQKNGAGSVKGAYGKWGGGDNLDTFNRRYDIAKGKGLSHEAAMNQAARKTKTGEWANQAGFKNVKVTKAEGAPGAFTNVEVEFTK
jgi:hypothetical protein